MGRQHRRHRAHRHQPGHRRRGQPDHAGHSRRRDAAVAAARRAFESFSQTSKEERIALLGAIIEAYKARIGDIAEAISTEMGCPISTSSTAQAGSGLGHLANALAALQGYEFEEKIGDNKVVREPSAWWA
jgi:aldehyde dehydrogenase (NAD+)